MDRRAVSGAMLTLLLVGVLAAAFSILMVEAGGTVYIRADGSVDHPGASIQRVGDIYTLTGDVSGSIVVERNNIVLDGAGYKVQGTGASGSIGIDLSHRSNVTVKNITVTRFDYGIYLQSARQAVIKGNRITRNGLFFPTGDNIRLENSNSNTIANNVITDGGGYGIRLTSYSSNNLISSNLIADNYLSGIYLAMNTRDNSIVINNIVHHYDGIEQYKSNGNFIQGNNITESEYAGISMQQSSGNRAFHNNIFNNLYGIRLLSSSDNSIYQNNFIDNTNQVYSYQLNNTWDDGYLSGGNYWSDYTGTDLYSGPHQNETGSDGIGDTPHEINADNRDRYPLMIPWLLNGNIIIHYHATAVYPGWTVNVAVLLQNRGADPETFNVTAYYDNYTIGNQTVEVAPEARRALTFTWDTADVPPCEYNITSGQYTPYTITVNVSSPTLDETIWYDGTVTVRRMGDANGDGHCKGLDFTLLAMSWRLEYGDPYYDPRADFNGDGQVKGADFTLLAMNW